MGTGSVAYRRATVLDRVHDHRRRGIALEHYASRGETPTTWRGGGTEAVEAFGRRAGRPAQERGRRSSAAS